MKAHQIDPSGLTLHALLKRLPQWADDDERFLALVEDVRNRGIDQPIVVTDGNRIIDGRHRWRAAKQLQLETVPVIERDPADASQIVLNSLVQRRHYTKGALAYLAYPLIEPVWRELYQTRVKNLKNQRNPRKATESTIEDLAAGLGIGRDLLFQARYIHNAFSEDPKLRDQFEEAILEGTMGLGAAKAGIEGQKATKGNKRRNPRQIELFEYAFDDTGKRLRYWSQFNDDERKHAEQLVRSFVASVPPDIFKVFESACRKRTREERQ